MEHIKHLALGLEYNQHSVASSHQYPTVQTSDEGQDKNREPRLHDESILGNRKTKIKERHNCNFTPSRPPQPFCPSFSVYLF